MLHFRSLFVFLALGSLAGCTAGIDVEDGLDGEDVDVAEEALVTATVYGTGGIGLKVRAQPNTSSSTSTTLSEGTSIGIDCQISGESVLGNAVWDYLPAYGGYVAHYYVKASSTGFIPGVPKCGASNPNPPASGLGAAAVTKARTYLGVKEYNGNCNQFSTALGTGCVEWCSDYVRYVWGQVGANTSGLSAASISFYSYGVNKGTWKPNQSGVVVKPGDAVVWGKPDYSYGAHVAMITEVSGSQFRIIHGNYDQQLNGNGDDMVYETGWVDRFNTAGTGYSIIGFISPK